MGFHEQQFYITWPFAIYLCPRRTLVRLIVVCIPLVWLYRIAFKTLFSSDIAMWVLLPNSMDALLIGALAGLLHLNGNLTYSSKHFYVLASAALTYFVVETSGWVSFPMFLSVPEVGATLICVCFAWLIIFSCDVKSRLADYFLGSNFLTYIGKISYGIYIMHEFIRWIVLQMAQQLRLDVNEHFSIGILSTMFTVLLASISWKYFELPIIRWRNRTMTDS